LSGTAQGLLRPAAAHPLAGFSKNMDRKTLQNLN
jgi:hypothetical protein